MQVLRNLFWVKHNHVNSVQFAPNFVLSLDSAENRIQGNLPDSLICIYIYLTVCTTEVRDKVNRSKSVSVAIDRK